MTLKTLEAAAILLALYVFAVVAVRTAGGAVAEPNDDTLFNAIAEVESGNNPKRVNAAEDAVGIVQIRPIMVADVNRIIGHERYTLQDRYDPAKSRQMFDVFVSHYRRHLLRRNGHPESAENVARLWNGGPGNWRTADAGRYWQKVKRVMEKRTDAVQTPSRVAA